MPAYPTHTLFSHMVLLALQDARHPLAGAAHEHAGLFRVAGIAGCDIQCMPYQVCRKCKAPYRHNQKENRTCLVCGKETLEDFSFALGSGRRLARVDVERDYYRHTHLVLGRYAGYGVDPKISSGPPEQPFPEQVVRHLANVLRDADKIAGPKRRTGEYHAFTLGWFSHVVADALFKGVYPQTVRVKFFGHQYHMAMLPAAETLSMTDIGYDFGVHWPTWHEELLQRRNDGGALRHLAMGDGAELYDPAYWTPEFGKPDPAIGEVMDAVQRINGSWFHRMYLSPDYTSPSPRLDARKLSERADWKFNGNDLGQVRRYAIGSGWYDTFIKGIDVYLWMVNEATHIAGIRLKPGLHAGRRGVVDWDLWRRIVEGAMVEHSPEWGSQMRIDLKALERMRGADVVMMLPRPATDYQLGIEKALRSKWRMRPKKGASATVVIGPPAFHDRTIETLCREDVLRAKYDQGLAGMISYDEARRTLHMIGLSDFGDQQITRMLNL